MKAVPTQIAEVTHGGLGVVAIVFFLVGFLCASVAQFGIDRYVSLSQDNSPEVLQVAADPVEKELIHPNPELTPKEVVEIQLAGLADAHSANGVEQCFLFASPGNKLTTGPLNRFAAMVVQPPFAVMSKQVSTLIGDPVIEGEEAMVMVSMLDEADEVHVFEFHLAKQSEKEVRDCWMTNGVLPLGQFASPSVPTIPATDKEVFQEVNATVHLIARME